MAIKLSIGVVPWRNYIPDGVTLRRIWEMIRVNWHLGFTAFGGPPVHFKIFNDKFVRRLQWIDEQMFQELFSVAQSLSGPASTKMLYCINLIHGGTIAAVLSFLVWSLPAAMAMYGLSIGVASIDETLPRPAYAVLSGLNAATVGVIALAAVELSAKSITDEITRLLVFMGAAAGLLYNALWYFPVLMAAAGCAALIHDQRWIHRAVRVLIHNTPLRAWLSRTRSNPPDEELSQTAIADSDGPRTRGTQPATSEGDSHSISSELRVVPRNVRLNISWQAGISIIAIFFLSFIIAMVLRGVLKQPPLLYRLFANMYLAGTIIFGGGPVVVPLLREYVVAEGWVGARDFLIGLALIQAFPGPNFNFVVFLGSLTAIQAGQNSFAGALIAWVGIFSPGLILVHGTMGVWSALRSRPWVKSVLRGLNAGAVGLIYTAVYRIWQVGYLDEGFQYGRSLGDDPWWVVVAAVSYAGGRWYKVQPAISIVLGAVLGLVRFGVVSS